MAEVFGSLREDKATHGEKVVLKLLRDNLPKEFAVYVECPLHNMRVVRYPDFIILTNYGVLVLEVKDWITVQEADKYKALIRTRSNVLRKVSNPVDEAREFAILLSEELKRISVSQTNPSYENVPWGFAAVLPNLPSSVISRLRIAWGEEFVLNQDDLQPDRITARLKLTLPREKVRSLDRNELRAIRAAINPCVLIEPPNRPAIILDEEQERIVTEPVKTISPSLPSKPVPEQLSLGVLEEPLLQSEEILPELQKNISHNISIRLVRGVAGSGKSLVLMQRARYLTAQYPEWQIAVLTFNNALSQHFDAMFKGIGPIKAMTFHRLCKNLIESAGLPWQSPINPGGWLDDQKKEFPVIHELTSELLEEEITWIKENGIYNLPAYLKIERKGRGDQKRLGQEQRKQIYQVLLAYQRYLVDQKLLDWADIPYIVLKGLNQGKIQSPNYDAILIDEAQDFAPIWMRVIKKLLDPKTGVLFLADDPTQSIYRFYSWREKGVEVVGRTRHLRLPYRNTYEIYRAAYAVIQNDDVLQHALESEGQLVAPEINDRLMRHGPKPLLQRCQSFDDEITIIREQIHGLLQKGVDCTQIAVLHRHNAGVSKLKSAIKGLDIHISSFHACKGLEFDYVFISQFQETFCNSFEDPNTLSDERRLVYMAMTRARQLLHICYQRNLMAPIKSIYEFVERI